MDMNILSIQELQKLSCEDAALYCGEIRRFLVDKIEKSGGHLASNLGVVEISVALARVFRLPEDKIIYDTGHQYYVHKILTGRAPDFDSLRSFGGISGFPRREESPFDTFGTGHSGTGLSAALGFAKAEKLNGNKAWSVAVIGDGTLTGGMVFEALNNIEPDDKIIIILNDNEMSISKSVGAVKRRLNQMRTAGYYSAKARVRGALLKLPGGGTLVRWIKSFKDAIKRNVLPTNNLFEQFGLYYFGPMDGNELRNIEFLLKEAKKKDRPSIIHLCTKKGKGYPPAEIQPTLFHGIAPHKNATDKPSPPSFSHAFGEIMCEIAGRDEKVVAITAAMCDGVGLCDFQSRFPNRLFDVGIAEEHAVTFAAALAAAGMKPCFAVYSTFFQRAFDQFVHDAALQKLPIVICLDRSGLVGEDGATHHGLLDIAMAESCPGTKIYAPASFDELKRHLEAAFAETQSPSVIRYSKGGESAVIRAHFPCREEIEKKVFGDGKNCVIITFGETTESAILAAEALEQKGIGVTLVRFAMLKGYSEEKAEEIFRDLKVPFVLFIEEGMKQGSFSQRLLTDFCEKGILTDAKKKILAIDDEFISHGNRKVLLSLCGLTEENIIKEVLRFDQN